MMKRLILVLTLIASLAFPFGASAQKHHKSRSTSGSTASTGPNYGGGHHTESHGGTYQGGSTGSSHKGGHYKNQKTNDHYGHHKKG